MLSVRGVIQVTLVVAALVAAFAPVDSRSVEGLFSTGVYTAVQRVVTPVSNLLPVAVFDLLTAVSLAWVVLRTVRAVRAARRERRAGPIWQALRVFIVATAAVYLVFLALWGLNYRRLPMAERIVLDRVATPAAALQLAQMAVQRLNELHAPAHDEGWAMRPHQDLQLRAAFAQVQQQLSDADPAVPGRLKWSIYGYWFRWSGIDGMVDPFALEVIRNPDLLPWELPFVAAHEWAHLAGYADESEANFVGWLTTIGASAPAQYSGWLFLYWQIASEIDVDARRLLSESLGDGPRQDIAAVVTRMTRGQWPLLRTGSWRVYDQYLRANRVEEGVRSYSVVITLILRARFEDSWVPVRRERADSPRGLSTPR